MQEGGTRTASAICMNEVETMVLNRDDFNGVLRKATQQAWHWPGVAWHWSGMALVRHGGVLRKATQQAWH